MLEVLGVTGTVTILPHTIKPLWQDASVWLEVWILHRKWWTGRCQRCCFVALCVGQSGRHRALQHRQKHKAHLSHLNMWLLFATNIHWLQKETHWQKETHCLSLLLQWKHIHGKVNGTCLLWNIWEKLLWGKRNLRLTRKCLNVTASVFIWFFTSLLFFYLNCICPLSL